MKVIDKIALIEIQNKRILGARSIGKTKFYLPGGKREAGESDQEALIREAYEELCIHIVPDSLIYVGSFSAQSDGGKPGVSVNMTCYKASYTGTLKASSEIDEIKWLSSNDAEMISEVGKIIVAQLKANGEID